MAIYRSVQLGFWTDNKILDDFTPEDKYFYLYLFTNPQTNLCGCYEVSLGNMANQLGYNKDSVERLLERFETFHKVIRYSRKTKELLLLNWSKYNWQGGKQKACIQKEIEYVKNSEFKAFLIDTFNTKFNEENTPCKGLAYPLQASVTVTDNNIYKDIDIHEHDYEKHSNKENLIYIFNNTEQYDRLKIEFKDAMLDWMEYKDERKPKKNNHYSEKSLKTWLTQTINKASEVGITKVINQINNAISNQWQGCNFNLIEGDIRNGK